MTLIPSRLKLVYKKSVSSSWSWRIFTGEISSQLWKKTVGLMELASYLVARGYFGSSHVRNDKRSIGPSHVHCGGRSKWTESQAISLDAVQDLKYLALEAGQAREFRLFRLLAVVGRAFKVGWSYWNFRISSLSWHHVLLGFVYHVYYFEFMNLHVLWNMNLEHSCCFH